MRTANDAKLWTTICFIIALSITDDLTANEQNALGNWLMLTAQVLCTNAFYKQVQAERSGVNTNQNISSEQSIRILKKMVDALNKEIEKLKSDIGR